ncbi:hypothetical protein Aph02nite_64850 [Actinoplanes philippinensis]|uniref:hypothetical protein n=1 Tax=Actinoplanes philippinensis TaxID=35752 RepID=UPI001160D54E|nr:hypothetical protein [Actinoplanes philippinensis]GIE80535.1 hypothetical protein Aph02nite_64850 [Actinoplanes philippinensis]
MSTIIEFFLAADRETAAAAVEAGPGGDALTYGNFDALLSIEEWESLLTGREFDDVEGPEPLGDDDGALVLIFPAVLTEALAGDVTGVAGRWLELRAEEGEQIDEDLGAEIVAEVAALAVRARRTGELLCCRAC